MPIDRERALAHQFPSGRGGYARDDVILYHLGVGGGVRPLTSLGSASLRASLALTSLGSTSLRASPAPRLTAASRPPRSVPADRARSG
jgi:hypothetical protein